MALTEICRELNNYFDLKRVFGSFVIVDSTLTYEGGVMSDYLQDGQYFRIVGSVFNDGVHVYSPNSIESLSHDETFDGAVWAMAVPPDLIALSAEIDAWSEKYAGLDSQAMSPYNSESFGGYSYSKSSGSSADGSGGGADWKSVFGSRLNKWRKIRCRY